MPPVLIPTIYQLKITLAGTKPPVWRRVQVPSSIQLCCLHEVIQTVMGWGNCHLHEFEKDRVCWGDVTLGLDELDHLDESKVQISQVLKVKGQSLTYTYDFGDSWRHKVELEEKIHTETVMKTAVCLKGSRRCPPEDIGGTWGYGELLEEIAHGEGGDHFDPDEFSLEMVNGFLSKMKLPMVHQRSY